MYACLFLAEVFLVLVIEQIRPKDSIYVLFDDDTNTYIPNIFHDDLHNCHV